MKIFVPATSANMGPGFDCLGTAVSMFLELDVLEASDKWFVEHDMNEISHDENNLIVKTALELAPRLTPHHLSVKSQIPLSRGLGSSSTAIVAGIELANQLANLNLSEQDKCRISAKIEGHPDNVMPAILGGMVVASKIEDQYYFQELPLIPFDFVAYIPSYELDTKASRNALPEKLAFKNATHASSILGTLTASLALQDYETAKKMIEADEFHEPYRQKLVPELVKIREIAHQHEAFATYLSGAGSTVMTIIEHSRTEKFIESLREVGLDDRIEQLKASSQGVFVEE